MSFATNYLLYPPPQADLHFPSEEFRKLYIAALACAQKIHASIGAMVRRESRAKEKAESRGGESTPAETCLWNTIPLLRGRQDEILGDWVEIITDLKQGRTDRTGPWERLMGGYVRLYNERYAPKEAREDAAATPDA